jgi:N-acetylglutamate synthase-like GNAT family acetyltransferase
MIKIEIAKAIDRQALTTLLLENGMEYIDPIEDFKLAWKDDVIAGCVRIERHAEADIIRPIVVAAAFRRNGVGRILLEESMAKDRPTVIAARERAIGFYKALGFTNTDWEAIPENQREECACCPDLSECRPRAMRYHRDEKNK